MEELLVTELMTRDVVTLGEEESLLVADDVMRLGRIRHLPVVNAEGVLVGLVTQRDILRASVSSLVGLSRHEDTEIKRAIPVRQIMQRDVTTIRPGTTALQAARLMLDRKYGCLPVVDDPGRLVGIVTEADYVRLARRFLENSREAATPPPA